MDLWFAIKLVLSRHFKYIENERVAKYGGHKWGKSFNNVAKYV